jgi:hypothetical protein
MDTSPTPGTAVPVRAHEGVGTLERVVSSRARACARRREVGIPDEAARQRPGPMLDDAARGVGTRESGRRAPTFPVGGAPEG